MKKYRGDKSLYFYFAVYGSNPVTTPITGAIGNETLTYYEVADIISKETKQKIIYTNPSILKFKRQMVEKGIKSDYIMVMIGIYTTAKLGLAKKITSDLVNLLGRSPFTMEEFVRDYKNQIV